jgi:hypothetical protein
MTHTGRAIRRSDGGVPPSSPSKPEQYKTLSELPEAVADIGVGGGNGNVIATHDGGGRVLKQARIVLIYWGRAWADATTIPSAATFTEALRRAMSLPVRHAGSRTVKSADRTHARLGS